MRVREINVEKATVQPVLSRLSRQKGALGSRRTMAGSNSIYMKPSTREYWVKLRDMVKLLLP